MNARLLVLGVLHRGDFHPYEIKRRLKAAMVECYIDIDVGTLYYAVRQLEKDGFIAAVAHERVARGGVRTIYRITPAGKAEFLDGLYQQLETEGPVSDSLYGALLFLHLADPPKIIDSLKRRLKRLDQIIAKLVPIRQEMMPIASTGGRYLLKHIDELRRHDRAFLQALLEEIEANGIRDVPDVKKLGTS
jgi:DNA-binding PadR family transcriptional regulator